MSAALARRQVLGRVKAIGDGCLCFSPVTQFQHHGCWKLLEEERTRKVWAAAAAARGACRRSWSPSPSYSFGAVQCRCVKTSRSFPRRCSPATL